MYSRRQITDAEDRRGGGEEVKKLTGEEGIDGDGTMISGG